MRARIGLLAAALALGGAFAPAPLAAEARAGGAAILVEVNGLPITQADLDEALAMDEEYARLVTQRGGAAAEIKKRLMNKILDALIDEVLVTEALRQARITLTPEEDREVARHFDEGVKRDWGSVEALEQHMKTRGFPIEKLKQRHRNGFLIRKLLQQDAEKGSFVRPVEVREYYDSHRELYQLAAALDLLEIRVRKAGRSPEEARAAIDEAKRELDAGKSFAEVAKKHPDGPAYDAGAKVSYPGGREGLPAEVRAGMERLKPGETSGVIETPKLFLIIRIEREQLASFQRFEDVQDPIYDLLEERARLERKTALLKRLRERAFVKRK